MRLVVSISGASGVGKSQLAKAVAARLGDDLCARVPADYFIVPATQPLPEYFEQPLAYDWDLLEQTLAEPIGTTARTPGLDFTLFQRTATAEQRPFMIRPVMVVDAMYPYPGADLTVLVEVPESVRRARVAERDLRWNTDVAARWAHLELGRRHLERTTTSYDLRLSGEQPLAENAAVIADEVQRRLA
jgi:uridine kinase